MTTTEEKLAAAELVSAVDDNDRVALNPDGTRTLTLNRPLKLKDKDLNELVFVAEVTVADLEESDKGKGDIASAARLVAACTGVSYANIRKMRSDDFTLAGLVVARISGNEEGIGGTS